VLLADDQTDVRRIAVAGPFASTRWWRSLLRQAGVSSTAELTPAQTDSRRTARTLL
jgi:hypothetical protein